MRRLCLLLALSLAVPALVTPSTAHGEELSVGTLAPKKSPWGKVLSAWAKAVKKKSKGKLTLKFYYNGSQGDEGAMVAKMRSGQLDGAAVTSVGLSKIYKNVLVLQMPGLFGNWRNLDKVRNALMPEFQAGMKKEGFELVGAFDVGMARTMSKGKAIRSPEDMKGMKVYRWSDDIIAPVTGSVMGYTGVSKSVPALLPALQSGQVNVITVSALAGVTFRWAPELDHIVQQPTSVEVGGIVISSRSLAALPADQRAMLLKTGKKAAKMLTKKVRKEDQKAYKRLSRRMTEVKLTPSEQARWSTIFKKVRRNLGQRTFPSSLVTKVEALAGK